MTRVCIIGDSHLAAVKLGWPRISAEFPAIAPTFFGAPITHLDDFVVRDGRLIAASETLEKFLHQTSGGKPVIDGAYGLYLVCGMGASFPRAAAVFKRYMARMARDRQTIPLGQLPDQRLIRFCAQALAEAEAFKLLAKLRQITDAPIGVMGTPLPSAEKLATMFARIRLHLDEARTARIFALAFWRAAKDANATFLDQPAETLGETALTTHPDFFRNAVRMAAEGEDQHHANSDYGAIVLRNALKEMWEFVGRR